MIQKIFAGMLAVVLVLTMPLSALAEDTADTTATEETVAAQEESTPDQEEEDTSMEPSDPTPTTQPMEPATPTTEPTIPTETEPTEPSTTPTSPTQPSEPTEPSQPTEPTQPTQPTTPSKIPTAVEIDTEHVYHGMDRAYEDGYIPRTSGNTMYLVLPLRTNGSIYKNEIKVSLGLGASASAPFEIANYEKIFTLESVVPKDTEEPQDVFLVQFDVALSEKRYNGVYPVTVNISGYDAENNPIDCIYTIYVTITDGRSTEAKQTAPEVATAEPVIYISGSRVEPEKAMAGEEFTLTVTLKNSLTTKFVRNMLVKVDTGNLHINLLEDSNVFQIDKIPAGGEAELTIHFGTDSSLPAGKYPLNFTFNYDSSKTLNLSSSGTTLVEIQQPANMELVMPRFADSVTVGETIPVNFQVMNMGRDPMYNVRCVVSGFGFAPSNTGYIGTMGAGTSATTKIELYIIALNASKGNENGNQYGNTVGTVTLIYENENGEAFQQETTFETTVNRPIVQLQQTDNTEEEKQKAASQWWVSVLILGGVILAAVIGIILVKKRQKNHGGAYL